MAIGTLMLSPLMPGAPAVSLALILLSIPHTQTPTHPYPRSPPPFCLTALQPWVSPVQLLAFPLTISSRFSHSG